ncbi:MAG TPA: tetratricopeptide repeat protein [Pseudonocardiaceae bacterium]|nr:tetratricopeptide repeat protein [Pseudonocardiaceae bacterium]
MSQKSLANNWTILCVVERLVVDVVDNAGGAVVSVGGGSRDGVPVEWPLSADELSDLRWYLEDYLPTPFGVYGDRGEWVAGRLGEWGRRMFDALFGTGPVRDAYARSRARGGMEIVFRSAAVDWLGLPWELMREAGRSRPLVLDGVAISRRIAGQGAPLLVKCRRLRVLMVISRPRGAGDVGYRTIARPLLDQLAGFQGQVELVVLRPPTLTALTETLRAARAAGEPFHVVHFDGHGALAGGTGVLVFEKPEGGADAVPADDVADALAGVPVVVLNACHSGAIGRELGATVATRLLAGGTSSVVAMAYSVYAVAAADFMTAFYRHLVAGGRITDAVTAGREQLAGRNERPSPKGPRPLADWMVPVHYSARDIEFDRSAPSPPDGATSRTPRGFEADGVFVGRDGLFYELEVAARLDHVLVLHGPGGTGKTELAKAFGRWWWETGAVTEPDLVIRHSFQPGSASFDLRSVLATIGPRIVGPVFESLGPDERRESVVRELAARRALVVWDNFESVHSMPDPTAATPTLDEAGRAELRAFLADVAAGGRSAVLITSRTAEPWLGDVRRIPLGGLSREEAYEYGDHLLTGHPDARRRREDRAFGELMEWLAGHPLSMRLTLPRLDTTDPAALLAALRGLVPLPGGDHTTSLSASITYSVAQLRADTRRMLVMVSLFHGVVDAGILALVSQPTAMPDRFDGTTLDDWVSVLREAADVGLLTRLRGSSYAVHPVLPGYLVELWRMEGHNVYVAQRAAVHIVLLDAYVAFANWASREIDSGNDTAPLAMIGLHQRNLGDLLRYSLGRRNWRAARAILRAFDRYWSARGARQQASEWADLALHRLESTADVPHPEDGLAGSARLDRLVWAERDQPGVLDSPAGSLWRYLVTMRAHRHLMAGDLDAAELGFLKIHEKLTTQANLVPVRSNLAEVCDFLAVIARRRGRVDEAENWHQKSRTLRSGKTTALDLERAGKLARLRGQLDDAEAAYRQSLAMAEDKRDWYGVTANYRELGALAHARGDLDEAETCFLASLDASKELSDRSHEAMSCSCLGSLALHRGRLVEAERWHRQSLVINEQLGLLASVAINYRALGHVAQRQGRLDHAAELFRGAVEIDQQLGDRTALADDLAALDAVEKYRRGGSE